MNKIDESIRELLSPRYKVIADFPGSTYPIGSIYSDFENATGWKEWADKYPHLFQPLPWYAERKPEDMPEYVKLVINDKIQFVKKSHTWRYHNGEMLFDYENRVGTTMTGNVDELYPATKQDYNTYINQKQN